MRAKGWGMRGNLVLISVRLAPLEIKELCLNCLEID